jgi:hypothetical protein
MALACGSFKQWDFIHAQQPDTIWLKCIECQLQAGNAGDFICA